MKAEERKDTPSLPEPGVVVNPPPPVEAAPSSVTQGLSDFFDSVRSSGMWNPKLFAIVLGIVLIGGVWWFLSGESQRASSRLWTELERLSPAELSAFAEQNKGDTPAKIARLEIARNLYGRDGVAALNSPVKADRTKGIENIVTAREQFEKLANEFPSDLTLRAEALRHAAEAELTLASIPKDASGLEFRGSVSEAVRLFRELAKSVGETTPIGEKATKRANDLEKNAVVVQSVGRTLNQQLNPIPAPDLKTPPSLPPITPTTPEPGPKAPLDPIPTPKPPATAPAPVPPPAPTPPPTVPPAPPATKK